MPHKLSTTTPPARKAAVAIIQRLRDHGHTAYLAGGCVRDALLGLLPKDYDVATDATPTHVKALFPRCQMVGEAFGVALVRENKCPVEVATFRKEADYTDHRRPDHVEFTTAEQDALRRDFTINGLFADPLKPDPQTGRDQIIDYVNGQQDIDNKIIRAIGDPNERFAEDYLRMLRAVRFAARLGFQLDPQTAASIRPLAKHLGQISRERIGTETLKMLTHPTRAHATHLLENLHLDGVTLNEDHLNPSETQQPLAALPDKPLPASLALAAWWITRRRLPQQLEAITHACLATAKADADRWRKALCLSNDNHQALQRILQLIPRAHDWPRLTTAGRKRLLAEPQWPDTWTLLQAINDPHITPLIAAEAPPLIAQGVDPKPLITGEDLIAAGIKPSPKLGQLLTHAYDAQLEGLIHDEASARKWLAEHTPAS
ncbi:CCA tRNA nucleotidyltransferase [Mucisphaera sp.]|uniref:CCA tRNA nucleotidyltransferase n=1 Tax=Mucisphaera sp. TaxID=2913024 RepID=UPI003D114556